MDVSLISMAICTYNPFVYLVFSSNTRYTTGDNRTIYKMRKHPFSEYEYYNYNFVPNNPWHSSSATS